MNAEMTYIEKAVEGTYFAKARFSTGVVGDRYSEIDLFSYAGSCGRAHAIMLARKDAETLGCEYAGEMIHN